ncbi:hypothetical protein [Brumimicrobium oceani]|uniref:DUF3575 domain-containing protein n=1 Tax=Brumimicrobium oceani TaxID=2100725 RepID=A0A2U2XC32_9FLAO|nr:hypothetical protein [Brumimicrobium oceani]PWH85355.1 hypothetical protein DIT68_10490 [Brumimicrobium oceani]
MKKILSVILFATFLMTNVNAQKEISIPGELNNNSIYVNAGYLFVYATLNVNYERIIKQHIWNKNISSFGRVGVGVFENWGGDGGYTMVQIGLLTGENNHHLEISAGFSLDVPRIGWSDEPLGHPFAGNIGWRFQKPDKNLIIRSGFGVPEGIYFGIGVSF